MISELDNFYFENEEPVRSCLLVLRDIIMEQDERITTALKYGVPCFTFMQKNLCYLLVEKKSGNPYMLFAEGKSLEYPELEWKDRKRMKSLAIDPVSDLPVRLIKQILQTSLELVSE